MNEEKTMNGEVPFTDDEETFALADLDPETRQGFDITDIRSDLTKKGVSYCSMAAVDQRAKVALYNAISKPEKIKKIINVPIKLAHIYIDAITIRDQQTGAYITVPRIVLIDDKANGYQAVSIGMYESVKRLIQMFGEPSEWNKPMTVKVIPIDLKNGGQTYNIEAVFD